MKEKKSRFCKQLLRAIFDIAFGLISNINTEDQVQIPIIDTNGNSKENQVHAANTHSNLERENRPDEVNSSLN